MSLRSQIHPLHRPAARRGAGLNYFVRFLFPIHIIFNIIIPSDIEYAIILFTNDIIFSRASICYIFTGVYNMLLLLLCRHHKVYYPVRQHLVQHMVTSIQRLGLSSNATIEQPWTWFT